MGKLGVVVRSFPRLSQTFVLSELLAFERLGLELELFPLTNPREAIVQPEVANLRAPVHYLDADHPGREASCLRLATRLAALIPKRGIDHLHAHFAHDPTSVAQLAFGMTGVPYSFTAHARDLYQLDVSALADRVARATHVVTCCRANLDYLGKVVPGVRNLHLVPHGVDVQRFKPAAAARPGAIVSVGRLVPKKGFPVLLEACHRLASSGRDFRCVIYGEGPLRSELEALIQRLGLAGRVRLVGACTQRQLTRVLPHARVFVLAPMVTADGDRDGVPNAILEAMACGLPVVSTAVGGIPEVVHHQENGLLADSEDADAIARYLAMLLDDDALRCRLGAASRQTAVTSLDARVWAERLATIIRGPMRLQHRGSPPQLLLVAPEASTASRPASAAPAGNLRDVRAPA